MAQRMASLAVPALAASVFAAGAPAAGAQVSQLDPFDRIGVTFDDGRKVFVVARSTSSLGGNAIQNVTPAAPANSVPVPLNIGWAPGAGSFALTELAFPTGGAEERLRIVEHPGGIVHDLSARIDQLRVGEQTAPALGVPRFGGLTPGLPRLMVTIGPNGVGSMRPDGTGGTLVGPEWFGSDDHALFANGLRAITVAITHTQNGQSYTDLIVKDMRTGAQIAQLTNTPFVSERQPALSPDESRVAYVESGFNGAANEERLFIVNVNGSGRTAIAPDTRLIYREPTWRPDGQRIAFSGNVKAASNNGAVGKPVIYSVKPDATDLQQHTTVGAAAFPNPTNINGIFPRDLAWGRTCTSVLGCSAVLTVASPSLGGFQLQPQLKAPASIGILVERYRGRRLVRVGRVPFGTRRKGRPRVRWDGRVDGRRLSPGRYRITLRRLASGIPIEVAQPADLIVRANGSARVARPRRL